MTIPLINLANLVSTGPTNGNLARALLGQGTLMGWGDEGEAWLRSKLNGEDYQPALDKIRQGYSKYSKSNPFISATAEFTGGAIPGIAAMMIPGGQATGAGMLSRAGLAQIAKFPATLGAVTGAISGAGNAEEGSRTQGALGGTVLGAVLGGIAPYAIRTGVSGFDWLKSKLAKSDSAIDNVVTQKLAKTLERSGMTPADIETKILADRVPGMPVIPSTIADTSQPTARLAEAVVNRAGKGADRIETQLGNRQVDARQRVKEVIRSKSTPENYLMQDEQLADNLRNNAKPHYDAAYAHGEVDDPLILAAIENSPDMHDAFNIAKKYADGLATVAKLKGENPAQYQLRDFITMVQDPKTGNMVPKVTSMPDVRTLDYMKKGLDAKISAGYLSDDASTRATASSLKELRNLMRDRLKTVVPEYDQALKQFAGDAEIYDALKAGRNDFLRTPHEEVAKNIAAMDPSTKQAYVTGAFRSMEDMLDKPANNANFAKRFLSPDMQARMRPLFNNDSEFNLVVAALQRESQLFNETGKILANSRTELRGQLRKDLEGDSGITDAVITGARGGFGAGLWKLATNSIQKAGMTEEVANRLANMLMSDNPHDVANVVKVLQQYNAAQAPNKAAQQAIERGTATGTTSAFWPSPSAKDETRNPAVDGNAGQSGLSEIERDILASQSKKAQSPGVADGGGKPELSEIERDILADEARSKAGK